jgi:hypothetical protein
MVHPKAYPASEWDRAEAVACYLVCVAMQVFVKRPGRQVPGHRHVSSGHIDRRWLGLNPRHANFSLGKYPRIRPTICVAGRLLRSTVRKTG